MRVSVLTKTALCRVRCCAHVGALTCSGSLRCSVQTSSPRRSRFLRSALALLHTHTNTHISGKKQSEGRLKCTLRHLNPDSKRLFTEASQTKVQTHTHTHTFIYSVCHTQLSIQKQKVWIYHDHPVTFYMKMAFSNHQFYLFTSVIFLLPLNVESELLKLKSHHQTKGFI